MKNSKIIALIIGVALLTYTNSLFNGFIGDSREIFTNNTFYKDLANFPKVFSEDLIMNPQDFKGSLTLEEDSYSLCVSYRPITAISFFADYFVWKNNPLGHHLTNILLHIITTLFVFLLVSALLGNSNVAALTALIFASHPIHSELVNSIGYRSDLLMAVFYLASLLLYIQRRKGKVLLASYACFAVALFSKETAVTLPFLLLINDRLFLRNMTWREFFVARRNIYLGYLAILLFYLYIYMIVMPNVFYSGASFANVDFGHQLELALKILSEYLLVVFIPLKVTILPPLYTPIPVISSLMMITLLLLIAAGCYCAVKNYRSNRVVTFGLLWFLINYLPISNLVPILNPFAFRFMYLPSIGLILAIVCGIEGLLAQLKKKYPNAQYDWIARIALVGVCMSATIPNNGFFKNDFAAAREMIRNYPDSSRPFWVLGVAYYEAQKFDKAIVAFEQYMKMDPRSQYVLDPNKNYAVHHIIARSYAHQPSWPGALDKAISGFKQSIQLRPDFAIAYVDLAKIYILKGEFKESLVYAKKAMSLKPDFVMGYYYALHSYIELGEFTKAEELLNKAFLMAPNDSNLQYIKVMLNAKKRD